MRAFTLLSSLLFIGQQVLSNPLKISINIDDEPQLALTPSIHHIEVTDQSDSFDGPFILQAFDQSRHSTPFYLAYSNLRIWPPRLALQGNYGIDPDHGVFTLQDGQLKMGGQYVHYDPSGWLLLLPELPEIMVRWRTVDIEGLGPALVPYFDHPLEPLFFAPDIDSNARVYACGVPEVRSGCQGEPNIYFVLRPFNGDL